MDSKTLVNKLFDTIKEQHNLPSDGALARFLDVPEMYIWRWRRGQYGTSGDVLIPLTLSYAPSLRGDSCPDPAEIAA